MIPIVSICTWLIFRKNKFNFWEHVLVNTYLSAQLNVIVLLIQLLVLVKYFITGSTDYPYKIFMLGFMTAFMTYYAIAFSSLMRGYQGSWKLGLKLALMCFILATVYATGMAVTGINAPLNNLTN